MEDQKRNSEQILQDLKEYSDLRIDLLKLQIVENLSQVLSILLISLILVLMLTIALFYGSMAFVFWTASYWGTFIPGFCIIALFFIVLGFILYLLRNKLFINPLVRAFCKIFFKSKPIPYDENGKPEEA